MAVVLAFTVVAATTAMTKPALAASPTIAWNQRGAYSPAYGLPNGIANVSELIPNGTRVTMICWLDNPNGYYYGNYGSIRWFYIVSFATGRYEYIPSSFVYYQTTVRRC